MGGTWGVSVPQFFLCPFLKGFPWKNLYSLQKTLAITNLFQVNCLKETHWKMEQKDFDLIQLKDKMCMFNACFFISKVNTFYTRPSSKGCLLTLACFKKFLPLLSMQLPWHPLARLVSWMYHPKRFPLSGLLTIGVPYPAIKALYFSRGFCRGGRLTLGFQTPLFFDGKIFTQKNLQFNDAFFKFHLAITQGPKIFRNGYQKKVWKMYPLAN